MSARSEQIVLEYLSRAADAAHGALRSDERMRFVARLRVSIEQQRQAVGAVEPPAVRRVLAGFGDPKLLVERERRRIDEVEAAEGIASGPPTPGSATLTAAPPPANGSGANGARANGQAGKDQAGNGQTAASAGTVRNPALGSGVLGSGRPGSERRRSGGENPGGQGYTEQGSGKFSPAEPDTTEPGTGRPSKSTSTPPDVARPAGTGLPAAASAVPRHGSFRNAGGAAGVRQGSAPGSTAGAPHGASPGSSAGRAVSSSLGGGPPGERRPLVAARPAVRVVAPVAFDPMSVVRRFAREMLALVLLGPGGLLLPFPLWLTGAVIGLTSRVWTATDKVAGVAGPLIITAAGVGVIGALNKNPSIPVDLHAYVAAWHADAVLLMRISAVLGAAYLLARLLRGDLPRRTRGSADRRRDLFRSR